MRHPFSLIPLESGTVRYAFARVLLPLLPTEPRDFACSKHAFVQDSSCIVWSVCCKQVKGIAFRRMGKAI